MAQLKSSTQTKIDALAAGGGYTWAVKTANYTMVSGDGILADSTSAAFTLTLPATPATGDTCFVSDGASAGSWGTNNVTVARNGSTIEGAASDYTLSINKGLAEFVYDGTTWQVREGEINANSLSQNGYVKFNNGTIIQWGLHTAPNDTTITFPISFPTACRAVTAGCDVSGSYTPEVRFVTKNNFRAGGFYPGTGRGTAIAYFWMAIGH